MNCPRGEIGRHKGLKILARKGVPVSVVADNVEIRNIKKVIVSINSLIKFRLLYDKNNSLSKKIKSEQYRRNNL